MKILFTLLLLLIFTTYAEADNYAKVCQAEYKKEVFDIVAIKKSCGKAAKTKEASKLYETASWFYLLSGNYTYNTEYLKKFITKKSSVIYCNVGHSYVLESNFIKAKEMYLGYLNSSKAVDSFVQDDFEVLLQLYPEHEKELKKGLALWDELYHPYKGMTVLLSEYPFIIKDTEHKDYKKTDEEKISYLLSIIKQQELKRFKVKNFTKRNARLLFYLYRDVSRIYKHKKEYSKEAFYYSKAIKYKSKYKKSPLEEIQMYEKVVAIYENLQDYKNAAKYALIILKLSEDFFGANHSIIIGNYRDVSFFYEQDEQYLNAVKYYKKIIKHTQETKGIDKAYAAESYRHFAELYRHINDNSNAVKYYKKSLETSGVDYKWMDKL